MKRKKLTHDEHVTLARKVRVAQQLIHEIAMECQEAFGTSHKATKVAFRIGAYATHGPFCALKSALDSEYHKVTTDEQFNECGHVYYNGERTLGCMPLSIDHAITTAINETLMYLEDTAASDLRSIYQGHKLQLEYLRDLLSSYDFIIKIKD